MSADILCRRESERVAELRYELKAVYDDIGRARPRAAMTAG